MVASTNRVLMAIVIMLFALVIKLITSDIDFIVFFIALAGVVQGWWGLMLERRTGQ